MTAEQQRDLLEMTEDRHSRGSTVVTSQLPVEHCHELIGNPTIADAILDRLVHNAHRLTRASAYAKPPPNVRRLTTSPPTDLMTSSETVGIIAILGRLQSVQAADLARNPRPTRRNALAGA